MTKNQQILFDMMTEKGHDVKQIYYYPTYGYLPHGGWFATVRIKSEDEEDDELYVVEYSLGEDFIEAKGQIENNEITLIED